MIETVTTIGSIGLTITTSIIAIIKSKKAGKSRNVVNLAKIVQKIPEFIQEAEQALGSGTGKAKLRYVLNQLQIECLKANIEYNEKELTVEIENILDTPQKKGE